MTPLQDTNVRHVATTLRRIAEWAAVQRRDSAIHLAVRLGGLASLLDFALGDEPGDLPECGAELVNLADAPTTDAAAAGDQSGPAGP